MSRFTKTKHILLASPLMLMAGCATVQRSPGIDDVRLTSTAAGLPAIHWRQGGPEDGEADASVQRLLQADLTSDGAVQVALLNNRGLQSSYERLRIAQADLVQAGLLKNPIFDGSLRYNEGGSGKPVIDLSVAFDFLDVLFIPLRKAVASAEFEKTKLDVAGAVVDAAGKTRTTFYELQAAMQVLEMRRATLASYEASYDLARRIRAAGNSTRLQLASEQALLEEAKLDVTSAEADVVTLREEMNDLMGLFGPAGASWTASSRLPDVPLTPFDHSELERRAVDRSIDLKVARSEVEVAAKRLGITKPFGALSDLEVGATAERDGNWSVGPTMALPIPLFTQGQQAVARSDAELRQAVNRYYATAVEVRSATRAAYARMLAAHGRALRYCNVVLPLRQTILDETQKQYNGMLVGAFELLQAKREQVDAGRQYIEALKDYWVSRAKLEQIANGRLTRGRPAPNEGSSTSSSRTAAAGGH